MSKDPGQLGPEPLRAEIARAAGNGLTAFIAEPENLAGLTGAFIMPLMVFRGQRMPLMPWLIVAVIGDQIFRAGWRAGQDLHDLAAAARDARTL